jgi:poly-D-alanine transfer protein DltD
LFLKEHDKTVLLTKIVEEQKKKRREVEKIIKEHIEYWLRNNEEFCGHLDIVREPSTIRSIQGYYDIRFSNTYWEKKKYFSFECKCLEDTNNLFSVKEYVYTRKKLKGENEYEEDGGVYRYLLGNKYTPYQNFGGMIGFLLKGNIKNIISKICDKLRELNFDNEFGMLVEQDIKVNSIENNPNTFDSIHKRKAGDNITLHHVIFDFTP